MGVANPRLRTPDFGEKEARGGRGWYRSKNVIVSYYRPSIVTFPLFLYTRFRDTAAFVQCSGTPLSYMMLSKCKPGRIDHCKIKSYTVIVEISTATRTYDHEELEEVSESDCDSDMAAKTGNIAISRTVTDSVESPTNSAFLTTASSVKCRQLIVTL